MCAPHEEAVGFGKISKEKTEFMSAISVMMSSTMILYGVGGGGPTTPTTPNDNDHQPHSNSKYS